MKKNKDGSSWRVEASGLKFTLEFYPVSIEKMTGFYIPEGKSKSQFAEYITSIDMELKITSNLSSDLDEEFEVKVVSEELYMDTEEDRYNYEASDEFDGYETSIPLYLYSPDNAKKTKERIVVKMLYGNEVIFEKAFVINIDGRVDECDLFDKPLMLEYKK